MNYPEKKIDRLDQDIQEANQTYLIAQIINLAALARATILRADQRYSILPGEARALALAFLERIGKPVKGRPATGELEHSAKARQVMADGPYKRMGCAPLRIGGSIDPEIIRKELRRYKTNRVS